MKRFLRYFFWYWVFCFESAFIQAQAAPTAVLTWTAPTTNTDGTPITQPLTYSVLQGTGTASNCTLGTTPVLTGVTTTTVTISSGLVDGQSYCWAVVTVEGGNSSVDSNITSKTFQAPTPNPATNLTAQ